METEVNSANDMAGTTQFLNEADVKVTTREVAKSIPFGLTQATRVGYDQDLKEFFRKPVALSSGIWSSQSAGDTLITKDIPEDALVDNVYKQKVGGFLGFKGKAVLRLQVNGNKFQAGRLLMCFIPQGQVAGNLPLSRVRSLIAATQLPRCELDLSSDTEVVMEIPYISPTPFYNLYDQSGPHGQVYVIVYSPLATGTGDASAGYTLWVHFEDVELVAPVYFAQMADTKPKRRANPTEQELVQYGEKPLSSGLRSMARAADSFTKIPLLSAVSETASWVLDCMSGVAAAFGYSKPTSETPLTKVQHMYQFHMQNFNGTDTLPSLAVDGSNKMQVLPGFAGTDADEMCLSHLVQIPAYFTNASWNTATTAGTVLKTIYLHPNNFQTSSIVNLWTVKDMTPVCYFSRFFDMWRGSFVITIKIVKTDKHSGRLVFVFNPCGTDPTLAESSYCLREVLDVRETSEFRFVVPYTSTRQYLETSTVTDVTPRYGQAYLYCLNELTCPDTVASSVDILFEVAGGPDYELAFPKPHGMIPFVRSTWVAEMSQATPSKILAESGSSRPDQNQQVVGVGSATITPPELAPSSYCIGEKINSILQLMKRYTLLQYAGAGTTDTYTVDFRPFIVGYAYSANPIALVDIPTGDYYSMFSPCFAYCRGGIRVMACAPQGVSGVQYTQGFISIYPSTSTTPLTDSGTIFTKVGACINMQPSGTPRLPIGATIPPYQSLHTRLIRPSYVTSYEPVDQYSSRVRVSIDTNIGSGVAGKYILFRAVGDDMTLGYFLGTPEVTTSVAY